MPGAARRWRRLAAGALLAALVTACVEPAQERYRGDLARTAPPERHAVHSERLRELMNLLDGLYRQRLPQELDVSSARTLRREEVAALARALAETALRIPEAPGADALAPAEAADFAARARLLRSQALALAADAPTRPPADLRRRLAALDATCRGCHERARPQREAGRD